MSVSALASDVAQIERVRLSGDLPQAMTMIHQSAKQHGLRVPLGHQYALALMANGDYAHALDVLQLLVGKLPDVAQLWLNLGQCCDVLGLWPGAEQAYRSAVTAHRRKIGQPDMPRAYFGVGAALFRLGRHSEAEDYWRRGCGGPCISPEAQYQRSQVLLALGHYVSGWRDYEARRYLHGFHTSVRGHGHDLNTSPGEWDGREQCRVVVYGEQGAGDLAMFARYLPFVAERSGQDPIFVAGPGMQPLLGYDAEDSRYDRDIALCSLPLVLGMPEPIGPASQTWTSPSNTVPRVGVCWQGSPHHLNDKDRSSPLDFRESFRDERWAVVSLQVGYDFAPRDYAETAALMRTLDAVVTVDTSIVHVAGTLGVPTVLIPPACPEWRWGMPRETTTPWYPSVRIVRRPHVDHWAQAIAAARDTVTQIVA